VVIRTIRRDPRGGTCRHHEEGVMQTIRSITALAIITVVLSACGGSPATQPPAGATTGTGGGTPTENPPATDEPAATDAGGGGGGGGNPAGWDRYGKVHVEMGGPVQKTVELGFIPAGSIFGGAQGSSLSFTNEGSNEVLSILIGPDNNVIVSYGGLEFSMPGTECTTSNWNIGATSGSGSFDCKASIVILASGASVTDGTLKGSFDAHAT
jgi:hypothetical protein